MAFVQFLVALGNEACGIIKPWIITECIYPKANPLDIARWSDYIGVIYGTTHVQPHPDSVIDSIEQS